MSLQSTFAVPIAHPDIPDKSLGIWQIPELNINIPVYAKSDVGKTDQQIVDDENSADWMRWGCAYQIGDHYNSQAGKGNWRIDKVKPLMLAYFFRKDGCHKYECYLTAVANVKSYGFVVCNQLLNPHSSKDILTACCVGGDSKRNFVAVFRYVGKQKYV